MARRLVLLLSLILPAACAIDDESEGQERFPCGDNGGSCRVGDELCVVEDDKGCSSCVPLDTTCDATVGCGCIQDVDQTAWDTPCADAPRCEASQEGLMVRCAADGWSCG